MRNAPFKRAYGSYRSLNKRLALGETVYYKELRSYDPSFRNLENYEKKLHYPRIGIYTGRGTSHSWLWFVELFDRLGLYNIDFLDEINIRENGLDGLDVLVMSGGDTFSIAEGLGIKGSSNLKKFIRKGGLYIGSCAGAYLPLNSSKKYLNLFNYVNVKIANISEILPEAKKIPEKFCTAYGCSFIFHPIREEVELNTNGIEPFQDFGTVLAPLYGGPALIPSESAEILAYYKDFTEKTMFLVERNIAEDIIVGKAAAVRSKMGSGKLYLFGPHFEHPFFPLANRLVAEVIYWDMRKIPLPKQGGGARIIALKGKQLKNSIFHLKRELSNSRIVALGMEMVPIRWEIGKKIYEPAKIRVFIEVIWLKLKYLEKLDLLRIKNGDLEEAMECASKTTVLLREMKIKIDQGLQTINLARDLFENLNKLSMKFLDLYFNTLNNKFKS